MFYKKNPVLLKKFRHFNRLGMNTILGIETENRKYWIRRYRAFIVYFVSALSTRLRGLLSNEGKQMRLKIQFSLMELVYETRTSH